MTGIKNYINHLNKMYKLKAVKQNVCLNYRKQIFLILLFSHLNHSVLDYSFKISLCIKNVF